MVFLLLLLVGAATALPSLGFYFFFDFHFSSDSLEYWENLARGQLMSRAPIAIGTRRPKNVVFFLGDGMGMAAVTAARIHKGQKMRLENNQQPLFFEQFLYAGHVKAGLLPTYSTF
jgi:hypothetical protein